jgi:NADH-quinone oxidoreductase subunit N
VALRTGAIPFHLWAARVADVAPGAALPLLLAWTPLVLAAVAVAAWDARVAPLGTPMEAERAVIIGVAVLTLAAGTLAALVQDDLEHLVGYLAIADSGIILLGLAGADPATVAPSMAWLVILAVSKSALGAWAVAMAARFGSRRLPDLTGWARRAPLLGVAFALTALATFGLPGWLAWDVRRALPELAAGDLAGTLLWLVALSAVVPYARILGAGLDRPTATVSGAPPERPIAVSLPPSGAGSSAAGAMRTTSAALRANRPLLVSSLVLVLGVIGVGLAAGGGGLADASSVPPPAISAELVGE